MVNQQKTAVKLAARNINAQKSRYLAILLIVFLSVGFLSGLKVTREQMWNAAGRYFDSQNLYDYRLYSTAGFTQDEIDKLADEDYSYDAEGAYSQDLLMTFSGDTEDYLCISMPSKINMPSLTAGRMPDKADECAVDHRAFSEGDIGKTIAVSDQNDRNAAGAVSERKFTITGLVNSPLYISSDRGAAESGSGQRTGFIYIPAGDFVSDYYTEADVTLDQDLKKGKAGEPFSKSYGDVVSDYEDNVRKRAEKLADDRYSDIQTAMMYSAAENLTPVSEISAGAPEIYVLTRNDNQGYMSFKSDTSIIHSIADIFPLFFILIALLVCITTMMRMVEEERGQIGTLKALGYSNRAVAGKYLWYSGSASLFGWAGGFFFGTYFLPRGFWAAYGTLYDFTDLKYLFDPLTAVITLAVAFASILAGTGAAVLRELRGMPASLIRPKSAKPGKRIIFEYITPLWKRLSFLQKAVMRNMFRYKIRMIMMIVGVGCSAALIVVAFGIRDSMIGIGSQQYCGVQNYQLEVTLDAGDDDIYGILSEALKLAGVEGVLPARSSIVNVSADNSSIDSVYIYGFDNGTDLSEFWNLKSVEDGSDENIPGNGSALVSKRLAEKLNLTGGAEFTVGESSNREATLKTAGSFINYIGNYIFVNTETYENIFDNQSENTLLIKTGNLSDNEEKELCEKLGGIAGVTSIIRLSEQKSSVDNSVSCLNYIIWLLVLFAGALSFIVIFNLTNINIAERSREIATVEVLGFRPEETRFYVLRENLVLSFIAGIAGMPLGYIGVHAVMNRILIDNMTFTIIVKPVDYLLSLVITTVFAIMVNIFMHRRIRNINMAESLKAVE